MATFTPAKFWYRFASFFLNLFILIFLTDLTLAAIISFDLLTVELFSINFWILAGIISASFLVLNIIIQGLSGYDIAKGLLGLKLLDANEDRPIGIIRSFLRTILAALSLLILALGYLAIAFNVESKSLHDLLTSSRVVKLPANGFRNVVRLLFFIISLLLGLVLSLSVITALVVTPYIVGRSFYNINKYASQESADLTNYADAVLTIPVSHNKVFALTELNKIEYIEFNLNKLSSYSFIKESSLERLGVSWMNYDLILCEHNKLVKAIIIPNLILKDINSHDVIVHNQRFIVNDYVNEFGNDILSLWDNKYELASERLSISLFPGDRQVIDNPELTQESKNYLLNVLRTIRADWGEYLKSVPVEALTEFSGLLIPPANDVTFEFDPATGYIKQIILNKPSESKTFNDMCESFFKEVKRFRLVPEELKTHPPIMLNINLQYKEIT